MFKILIREKGFTLAELMVVVIIIGILLVIAIPVYNMVTDRAKQTAHDVTVKTLKGVATTALTILGSPKSEVRWGDTQLNNIGDWDDTKWIDGGVPEGYTVIIGIDGTVSVSTAIGEPTY